LELLGPLSNLGETRELNPGHGESGRDAGKLQSQNEGDSEGEHHEEKQTRDK